MPNLVGAYYKQNQEQINKRLIAYLYTEFLGGLKDGDCKNQTLMWFQDIGAGKLNWAFESDMFIWYYIMNV